MPRKKNTETQAQREEELNRYLAADVEEKAAEKGPKYPHVVAERQGFTGNIIDYVTKIARDLREAGVPMGEIHQFRMALYATRTHDDAFKTIGEWVTVK